MFKRLQNSAPYRKGAMYALRLPRYIAAQRAVESDFRERPPILVNSLPKSGTHLLMQIALALPGASYYRSFIAQTPSLTLKERTQEDIDSRIAAVAPGEVVGSHLHYSSSMSASVHARGMLNLFIYRDPRDVALSEAHYLAEMNPYHRMHRRFASISDPQARIRLSIEGDGTDRFPSIAERVRPYMGWADDPDCLSFRYEDLVDEQKIEAELHRLSYAYVTRSGIAVDPSNLVPTLIAAIAPEASHTFRSGGVEKWRKEMDAENRAACERVFASANLSLP